MGFRPRREQTRRGSGGHRTIDIVGENRAHNNIRISRNVGIAATPYIGNFRLRYSDRFKVAISATAIEDT
jgi:hypothetical protein